MSLPSKTLLLETPYTRSPPLIDTLFSEGFGLFTLYVSSRPVPSPPSQGKSINQSRP